MTTGAMSTMSTLTGGRWPHPERRLLVPHPAEDSTIDAVGYGTAAKAAASADAAAAALE